MIPKKIPYRNGTGKGIKKFLQCYYSIVRKECQYICEICHSNPHNVSCPNNNVSATVRCDICGKHYIKSDVICYDIDGYMVCENCIAGYVRGLCDEDEPTATTCDICGQVIAEDDICYDIDGNEVCYDCIEDYVYECRV